MDKATLFKLASGSTMAISTRRVKNFPQKGCGLGHVIVFRVKPSSVNFTNVSTMASATPGVKIGFGYASI